MVRQTDPLFAGGNFAASFFYLDTMKFKPTILNVYALLFLAGCIVFTIYNYTQLSEGEGWGVVSMVGLFGFGILLLFLDMVIRLLVRNNKTANKIGLAVSIVATLVLVFGGLLS